MTKRSLLRGCIKHYCNHLNNSRLDVVVALLPIRLISFFDEYNKQNNLEYQSATSVFGKKNIRVHQCHPWETKRKSAVFLHVSFFLFTFAPCLYALTGKTGYVLLRRRQAYRGAAGISRHYGLMLLQRPSRETNCCRSSIKDVYER